MSEQRLQRVASHLGATSQIQESKTSGGSSSSKYRFTLDNGILTEEQRKFYEKNGFLVIRGLLKQKDISIWENRFLELCDNKEKRVPTMTVMRDVALGSKVEKKGKSIITKVQDWQDDPVLFTYCKHPNILKYISAFCGPDIKSIHTMLINKPPDLGKQTSRHPLHQDLHYFPFRPADRIVCSWTAMQRIDRTNGCLSVVPGTHKDKLLPHGYPDFTVNKAYHGIQNYSPPENRVHLIMEAGDTVFFHPILVHGSGTNRSSGFRRAISCHYASATCDYIDVKGTTQEDIGDEVVGIAKKRFGVDVAFQDVWRLKSRLVAGKPGTL